MKQELFDEIKKVFIEKYNQSPSNTYYSPGRINLIGEHIDYNGGCVFPAAITMGTYGMVRKREDRIVRCYSMNFPELNPLEFKLNDIIFAESDEWVNYVKGVLKYFIESNHKIESGFDLVVYGEIPNGAGLSSSASLEMLVGILLKDLYNLNIERLEIIKIGQMVENEFIGVNSGIMDQFAVGMGQKDMAIYLDTDTLYYDLIPANFKDKIILIMNTNKRRELADSKYNQRKKESEEALEYLQKKLKIKNLGELQPEQFEKNKYLIEKTVLQNRAKHVVYENYRVEQAVEILKANQLEDFGKLMNESHISLRDNYDITGIELDTLVDAAWKQEGVLGARMTGAGMGGCAIALVDYEKVESVIDYIQEIYTEKIGYKASFYIAEIGDGAKVL